MKALKHDTINVLVDAHFMDLMDHDQIASHVKEAGKQIVFSTMEFSARNRTLRPQLRLGAKDNHVIVTVEDADHLAAKRLSNQPARHAYTPFSETRIPFALLRDTLPGIASINGDERGHALRRFNLRMGLQPGYEGGKPAYDTQRASENNIMTGGWEQMLKFLAAVLPGGPQDSATTPKARTQNDRSAPAPV